MAHTFFCERCGKRFDVGEALIGRRARCVDCKHEFIVPGRKSASAPPRPAEHNPYMAPLGEINPPRLGRPDTRTGYRREQGGSPVASLVLGGIGLVAWLIPIAGLPIAIAGLILGKKARRSGMATTAVTLNFINLTLVTVNMALGAYLGYLRVTRAVQQVQQGPRDLPPDPSPPPIAPRRRAGSPPIARRAPGADSNADAHARTEDFPDASPVFKARSQPPPSPRTPDRELGRPSPEGEDRDPSPNDPGRGDDYRGRDGFLAPAPEARNPAVPQRRASDTTDAAEVAELLGTPRADSAIATLQAMGSEAEPEVITYLRSDNWFARKQACQVLRVIGTEQSVAELRVIAENHGLSRDDARAALQEIARRRGSPVKRKTSGFPKSRPTARP